MMSILPPSNAFLVLTRFATFLLQVRIRSYMNTQLERVNRLEQHGDHACSEWNDQVCLLSGQRGMTVAEILLLVSEYYSDAHGCSNQTIDAK